MVDPRTTRRWAYRLLYVLLAGVLILVNILPFSVKAGTYPGPDLLICLTFAWVLRRPRFVPILAIATVFLATDMLYMRPPGLWTALVVIGVEMLRSREGMTRDTSFLVEWVLVAVVLSAMVLANRIVLSLTLVDQAGLGLVLLQLLATLLAYPLVVAVTQYGLGVRKIAPSEADAMERRA